MNPTQIILNVIHTIGQVKTDNTEGNWDKLLGCQMALKKVLQQLEEKEKKEAGNDGQGD